MKQCYKCGAEKTLEEFLGDKTKKDGKSSSCKTCSRLANKLWKKTPKGKAYLKKKKTAYRKSETGKAAGRSRWKRKMEAHPEKIRARNAVKDAMKDGRLKRLPCEVCGNPKSEAHHDDYSNRLDVKFLCAFHHREHHEKFF